MKQILALLTGGLMALNVIEGHQLRYQWLQIADADSGGVTVTATKGNSPGAASFVVPAEPGKEIRLILEVTDSGTPPLVAYQSVICKIK